MSKARIDLIARILLALMVGVFGANKFLQFMPQPDPPEAGGKFLGALMDAGYVFPAIGIVFIVSALLLLANRVVLALVLLAPIAVNILGYHIQYDLAGAAAGGVLAGLLIVLAVLRAKDVAQLFAGPRP